MKQKQRSSYCNLKWQKGKFKTLNKTHWRSQSQSVSKLNMKFQSTEGDRWHQQINHNIQEREAHEENIF